MPHTVGDAVEPFHFVCLFVCLFLCFGIKEGRKREKVTEKWRKMHSEELHHLCFSPNIIRAIKSRMMRRAGHVARVAGEERCSLLETPEGRRPPERTSCRWKDNVRIALKGIGWEVVDWLC
jgi:hypothetical protein